MKRREFLEKSAFATVGSLLIPSFLKALEKPIGNYQGKKLVIIQLSGGNDGLNTVIPYTNDLYYKARPHLAIPIQKTLKLTDEQGFHPAMEPMKKLFEEGLVGVFNSVGYPNPDRSHFRSMDIWQTASNSDQYLQTGWIGRFLDAQCKGACKPYTAVELDDTLSLALKGLQVKGLSFKDPKKLYTMTQSKKTLQVNSTHHHDHQNIAYLYKTLAETTSSAAYIHEKNTIKASKNIAYPNTELAKHLRTIAEMIKSNLEITVYYVSLSGFDTHINQAKKQEQLLSVYSEAVYSFVKDLQSNQALDDTLILTFSEFGRRVSQNASGGTDHGTANNVFVVGNKLKKAGFQNASPNLSDLDEGDLKYQIDFRNIYATLLNKHLPTPNTKILGDGFTDLAFL